MEFAIYFNHLIYNMRKAQNIFFILISFFVFLSFGCNKKRKENYLVSPSNILFSTIRGSSFDTTVYVKNTGSEKLIISEIATPCGCLVGKLSDSSVQLNDSVPMRLFFTPNASDSGEVIRYISIRTNGIPSIKTIELRGHVN
jgi:hypothetical protein